MTRPDIHGDGLPFPPTDLFTESLYIRRGRYTVFIVAMQHKHTASPDLQVFSETLVSEIPWTRVPGQFGNIQ
ncbi:hypothetical protein DLM46_34585 [Paraburkholderia lacunae]|uniref:Uncharacterized protein n=1 Tax=Paraburkholderia lacunae TaxID=2211104 RepID=A0A370MXZ1_9BURK|nr:hypothetical protein DLM46_34585 [Paraburkholderia lacunae]